MTVKLNLTKPDIALIPNLSDYPALVVHRSFDETGANFKDNPIGTGPFELVSYDVGQSVVYKRRENGTWWGGEAYLDGVEFIDYGTDPSAMVSAFEAGEVQANHETSADFVSILEGVGMETSEAVTAATIVARTNVNSKPYDDQKVRKARQLAVDRAGPGPRLRQCRRPGREPPRRADPSRICRAAEACDIEGAKAMMTKPARWTTSTSSSRSTDWHKNTGDAIAAQLRRPASRSSVRFCWAPPSGTTGPNIPTDDQMEHASAGRPGPVAGLSQRRSLNEAGYANAELDG